MSMTCDNYRPPYFPSRRILQETTEGALPPSTEGAPPPSTEGALHPSNIVGIIIVMVICLITILGTLAACLYGTKVMRREKERKLIKKRKKIQQSELLDRIAAHPAFAWEVPMDAPSMEKILEELAKEKPIRFSAQQLWSFTNNFSSRLGSGGFGVVYKGEFPNGVKIAVKVLNRSSDKAIEQQFVAEVGTIGRTYHINLVRLHGFCYEQSMIALVYEYMEHGSLDNYLFSDTHIIEWQKLYEIAIGTAKGITYLHEQCAQKIIHYDIKPGNVLLDQSFSPKVADFGLAKLYNHDNTHASVTGYKGTPGYSAPEFLLHSYSITEKCDVYSFGMMLFEIVGRRRNTKSRPTDSLDWFPKHVWDEYEKGKLDMMAESCGIEEKDIKKAERVSMVALWCVQDSPEARPPMSTVVKMLEGEMEIMHPPKPFNYLFSVRSEVLQAQNSGSNCSTSEGSNSYWYKDDTPIMAKYEIQFASSTNSEKS